ncbi:MAG: TerC family protein, partial [Rhizobiaceae bacterium]
LVYKATAEIHEEFEGESEEDAANRLSSATFASIIGQIIIIDMVFSVDSIVTAIGMAQHLEVMVAAVVVAVAVMYVASGTISSFIKRHPTTKMLALSFLLLIGVSLVADGMGFHIPRGYIYAAMGFSVMVEAINIMAGKNRKKSR